MTIDHKSNMAKDTELHKKHKNHRTIPNQIWKASHMNNSYKN